MQFLADIRTVCPECRGTRFGRETLDVTYRGRHIADVLSMSVAEAFTYFRGEDRLRRRLQFLRDVGLDSMRLGQPARQTAILAELGDYPHAKLDASNRKKQTTRLIKTECPRCGYTARVARKWLDVGAPICPTDNVQMV